MSLHVIKPPEPEYRVSKWRLALCMALVFGFVVGWAQFMVSIKEPTWAGSVGGWVIMLLVIFPYSLDWIIREVKTDEPDQDS